MALKIFLLLIFQFPFYLSQTLNLTTTLLNPNDIFYSFPIDNDIGFVPSKKKFYIGTPPQQVFGTLDTLSAEIIIPTGSCIQSCQLEQVSFQTSASSTFTTSNNAETRGISFVRTTTKYSASQDKIGFDETNQLNQNFRVEMDSHHTGSFISVLGLLYNYNFPNLNIYSSMSFMNTLTIFMIKDNYLLI